MSFLADVEPLVPSLRRFAHALAGAGDAHMGVLADGLVAQALDAVRRGRRADPQRSLRLQLFGALAGQNRRRLRSLDTAASADAVSGAEFLAAYAKARVGDTPARIMANAMDRLALEQREVLLLVALEGLSYVEAAQALETPLSVIMQRLTRARDTLAQLLEQASAAHAPPASAALARRTRHLRVVK